METRALDRSQVAGIQKYLLLAAERGDDSAIALYRAAADELGLMVLTAARKIQIPGEQLRVSVSGGLMHAEKFFLDRFLEWAGRFDGQYIKLLMTPVKGAALMAVEKFRKKSIV